MNLWKSGIWATLLLLMLGNSASMERVHDFHISKIQVNYAFDEQEWQISVHVFIDDLEEALRQQGSPDLSLGSEQEADSADDYILKYLQRHFTFTHAEQLLAYEWIGKEMSEDLSAFWIYLYVPDAVAVEDLTVKNQLLLDIYSDQQNMLQLIDPQEQQHYVLFHQDRTSIKLQFGE